MALWNSGVTWSSGSLWSPTAPPQGDPYRNRKPKHRTMKREFFYPRRVAERPEWHANLAAKLPIYGPALGLTAAQINNGVAGTASIDLLASGKPNERLQWFAVVEGAHAPLAVVCQATANYRKPPVRARA